MTAIVLATGLSHLLSGDTIYTLKLRRRGVDLGRAETIGTASHVVVGDIMTPVPDAVRGELPLHEVATALAGSASGVLPVVGENGEYVGIVTARVVAEALADGRHDAAPASLVIELPVLVRTGDHLDQAIEALDRSGCAAVPVLEADRLVGWISYRAALRAMPSRPTRASARSGVGSAPR